MEPILEGGGHAKISASAANRPKKIWIRVLTGLDLLSIDRHKLRRYQVVARGAVLRHQESLSSAERQASNSYIRATTRCRGQTEVLRCVVQVAHQRTCLCPGHALARVDFDPVHPGEVDDHAAIAHAESGSVMAPA